MSAVPADGVVPAQPDHRWPVPRQSSPRQSSPRQSSRADREGGPRTSRTQTVAVVGVGGIGTTVAHALDGARCDVTLCRRGNARSLTVVRGGTSALVRARVATDPADVGEVDWVLLATKAVDDPSAWLERLVGPRTRIAVLQNGIDLAARVARWVDAERCLPVVVDLSAERTGTDEVVVRHVNALLVAPGRLATGFASLMGPGLPVRAVADFEAATWRKLMLNVVVNSLTTLTGVTSAQCVVPPLSSIARGLLEEVCQVAAAAGVRLSPDEVEARTATIRGLPPIPSSMQEDLARGRRLEHEFITGVVVQHATRWGVPVPVTRTVHALLTTLSAGTASRTEPAPA